MVLRALKTVVFARGASTARGLEASDCFRSSPGGIKSLLSRADFSSARRFAPRPHTQGASISRQVSVLRIILSVKLEIQVSDTHFYNSRIHFKQSEIVIKTHILYIGTKESRPKKLMSFALILSNSI